MTLTLAGDTVVDGRTYRILRAEEESELQMSGEMGGAHVEQYMAAPESWFYLWDHG